jgi:N-methylhydantoinase A
LGIDVGGTFTDFALWNTEKDIVTFTKVPSTPLNEAKGVIDGIEELGCPAIKLERIVHGTTVGTNAILQSKGAVGLITTKGFEPDREWEGRGLFDLDVSRNLGPNPWCRGTRFEIGEESASGEGTSI